MGSEQVVMVTGAFSGIGLVITELLMKSKNKVVAVGRNQQHIYPSFKTNFLPITRNLHTQQDAQDVVEFATERFGRIDVVVHAAGRGLFKPSSEQNKADFERMLLDNFYSAALLSQVLLPYFKQAQAGTQIFILPIMSAASADRYGAAHYAAKAALAGYVESIRAEAQKNGIRLSTVETSPIHTSFWEEKEYQNIENQSFISKIAIAKAILSIITQPASIIFDRVVLSPNSDSHSTKP